MSFFEDYQEDGLGCIECGEFIDENPPGHPRKCAGCKRDDRRARTRPRNKPNTGDNKPS